MDRSCYFCLLPKYGSALKRKNLPFLEQIFHRVDPILEGITSSMEANRKPQIIPLCKLSKKKIVSEGLLLRELFVSREAKISLKS